MFVFKDTMQNGKTHQIVPLTEWGLSKSQSCVLGTHNSLVSTGNAHQKWSQRIRKRKW